MIVVLPKKTKGAKPKMFVATAESVMYKTEGKVSRDILSWRARAVTIEVVNDFGTSNCSPLSTSFNLQSPTFNSLTCEYVTRV